MTPICWRRAASQTRSTVVTDVARADIERALSLDPNNSLAYYARGYLNQKIDKS